MSIFRHLFAAALVLGSLCLLPGNARAAQSYDNCAGFIDSLPATISTQGVWCLRKDLATSMTSGNAINITTNNVTIDCNDFKIGGLGAGNASTTSGIYANNRQNVTVRHCNVRGFHYGIIFNGGAGHLVEDNRLDNSLYRGIYVSGDNNRGATQPGLRHRRFSTNNVQLRHLCLCRRDRQHRGGCLRHRRRIPSSTALSCAAAAARRAATRFGDWRSPGPVMRTD